MIFIILSWIYITAISFVIGFSFTGLIRRLFSTQDKAPLHFTLVCINGLIATSFIISIWSLFYKVDLLANLAMLALSLIAFIASRKSIADTWKQYWGEVKSASRINWFFFLVFVFVMAGIAYIPTSHADDAGAFAPLIRWIQEYKATPGIANLEGRFGYNSTWFQLQALYGFAFLKAGLFNDLNGLLFLLVLLYALQGVEKLLKDKRSFRNFLQAFFFLPLLPLYFGATDDVFLYSIQFFTCPTYDIPVTFITWLVFLLFLNLKAEEGRSSNSISPYLIVIYIAYLVTVKLNAVPLGILELFIVGKLLWQKKYRNVITACLTGVGLIIPWMARTVISCGFLLFPYSGLDVLPVDWKLPVTYVRLIENSVMTWAIDPDIYGSTAYTNGVKPFSVSVTEWFPFWFEKLNFIDSVIFYSTVCCSAGFFLYGLLRLIRTGKSFIAQNAAHIVLYVTILSGIGLWFFKGPLFRYGYMYLVFGNMIMFSGFVYYFLRDYKSKYVGWAIWAFFLGTSFYYYKKTWNDCRKSFFKAVPGVTIPSYTRQDMGNGLFINVVDGPTCGHVPPPCSPKFIFDLLRPTYRGNTVTDGFRTQRPNGEMYFEYQSKK